MRTPATLMPSRRHLLGAAAATGAVALLAPRRLGAQEPRSIRLGSLVPLSEDGAPDGNAIKAAQAAVIDEVNEGGGLLHRKLAPVGPADRTSLAPTIRAARKLMDKY